MRHCCLPVCVVLLCASLLSAQEESPAGVQKTKETSDSPQVVYQIDVIEFSLKEEADTELSSAAILKLLHENTDRVQRLESIRLTAVSGVRSMVSFGKTVPVIMGVTQSQFGKTKNTRDMQVGTMMQVSPKPLSGSLVYVTFNYESARIKAVQAEDQPPEITKFNVSTELQLKPGTPTLVSGSSADDSSYLVATIREVK